MSKIRTTIYIEEKKAKELKKKAIDIGISLSDLMSISASEVNPMNFNSSGKDIISDKK